MSYINTYSTEENSYFEMHVFLSSICVSLSLKLKIMYHLDYVSFRLFYHQSHKYE